MPAQKASRKALPFSHRVSLFVLGMILVGGGFYFGVSYNQGQQRNWKSYTDKILGVKFSYPSTFILKKDDPNGGSVSFNLRDFPNLLDSIYDISTRYSPTDPKSGWRNVRFEVLDKSLPSCNAGKGESDYPCLCQGVEAGPNNDPVEQSVAKKFPDSKVERLCIQERNSADGNYQYLHIKSPKVDVALRLSGEPLAICSVDVAGNGLFEKLVDSINPI